jgi:hypothetical protein
MRTGAVILGVLGSLTAVLLGIKWLSDANEMKATLESLQASGADLSQINGLINAAYCLIGALVLGIAGVVVTLKKDGKLGGALMLVGAVLPAIFTAKALLGTFLLLVGGVLALLSKPRASAR